MTNNEVNKVIAKYMGLTSLNERNIKGFVGRADYKVYTEALDSLVPVWERLKEEFNTEMIMGINLFDYNGLPWNCEFETQAENDKTGGTGIAIEHPSKSAFEAASHATAKAILALEGK